MIAAIISFCTIDSRFIKACIEQTRLFAQQIIIPVCDHFFDGTPENRELLDQIYRSFPDCQFIQYPFIAKSLPVQPLYFWHNLSRFVAFHKLNPEIDSVLFIDADEIPDGKKFAEWLATDEYRQYNALKLLNYWYFREPIYRALDQQASILMVQPGAVDKRSLVIGLEREGIYDSTPEPKKQGIASLDGEPMFHHYSWVRTKEEMIRKTATFNHRQDKNWAALIEEEFSRPFTGVDFVHGFKYKTVDPYFGLSLNPPQFDPILAEPSSMQKINFNIQITLNMVPEQKGFP